MKQLFFVAVIFAALCSSCGSHNSEAVGNSAGVESQQEASPNGAGAEPFSYNLDGTKISGGKVDEEMRSNVAIISHSSDHDNKLSFFLNDAYKDNTEKYAHSLNFTIPDKTGTITIAADDNNFRVQLFLATAADSKYTYILYGNESFTVTITNISASSVSGTFSGKEKIAEGQGAAKDELTITDGKFDIPVKTNAH